MVGLSVCSCSFGILLLIFIVPIWRGFTSRAQMWSKSDTSVAESRTEEPACFVSVPV